MTLYVVQVPDPPAGQDWLAKVPGQYLYDITAITATLSTPVGPDALTDASGNGLDGIYVSDMGSGYPALVPGLVAGNGARQWEDVSEANEGHGFVAGPTFACEGPLTVEFLYQGLGFPTFSMSPFNAFIAFDHRMWVVLSTTGVLQFVRAGAIGSDEHVTNAGAVPDDGTTHHVAVTWDGTTALVYVDGSLVPWAVDQAAAVVAPGSFDFYLGNLPGFGGTLSAITDETAVYDYPLSAGRIAAHVAAIPAGFVAYSAAVFADAPTAYYHLGSGASGGRTPALDITDGTSTVVRIGDGFPASAAAGPFKYAWQPNLPADSQTADGTTTTVGIPRLIIPAGYTIGSRTPDLGPGDQWSDVVIWWDDTVQQLTVDLPEYGYPPGAYYTYRQIGS